MAPTLMTLPAVMIITAIGGVSMGGCASKSSPGRAALPAIPQEWTAEGWAGTHRAGIGRAGIGRVALPGAPTSQTPDSGAPDSGAPESGTPESGTEESEAPEYKIPAEKPSGDQAGSGARQIGWRAALSDPLLDGLIEKALAHNNDIAIAAARVKASHAALRRTRAGLLPDLSLNASRQRRADLPPGFTGSASDARVYSTGYRASTQLDWEIDLWGRLSSETRAAYLDRDASEADLAAARLSIALNLANLWYRVVEGDQQINLANRDVETGNANLSIIERRYKSGLSSSLDVRLAKASLENSKSQLAGRERQQHEAIRAIEVLLGEYPGATLDAAADLPVLSDIDLRADLALYAGTPARLLDRRPDILSAERSLQAAGLRVKAARRALVPALRLSGVLTNTSDTSRDIFSVDAVTGMLTASLVQPLFQGGRLRANVAQQKAALEIELHDYVRLALNAFREVEDSLSADRYLSVQEKALAASFEESVAAERLTDRQYRRGTTTIFNLINAQQRRIQTESQLLSVQRQRISNRLTLVAALGIDPAGGRLAAGAGARLSDSNMAGRVYATAQDTGSTGATSRLLGQNGGGAGGDL